MLARTSGLLILFTVLSAPSAELLSLAQPPQQITPVRYHFGDDAEGKLGWADSNFDDASWPVASHGRLPAPAFFSDGFVWLRIHVPAPAGLTGPLALEENKLIDQPDTQAIFVNGQRIGGYGAPPPHSQGFADPPQSVFPLPHGLVQPGSSAVVVIRAWSGPANRGSRSYEINLTIDGVDRAQMSDAYRRQSLFIGLIPNFAIYLPLGLVGVGLAILWGVTRRRDLGLFALFLLLATSTVVFFSLDSAALLTIPMRQYAIIYFILMFFGSMTYIEVIWSMLQLGARAWKYVAIFAAFLGASSYSFLHWADQATPLVAACLRYGPRFENLRDVIECAAIVWALVFRPRRLFATMLLLPLVGSYIADFRGINSFELGRFSFNYFTTGILFVDFALVFLLLHDMWKSWRKGNDYRVEMASAREVQQRLVPAALPEIAAYRLAAAYLPAAEVGGDFYQVLEQRDSAALILVGDVSGKGLKAAMKGALAIGAARTLASEELNPGLLLTRLNRELVRAQDGGFITCLCARIARDGAVILANAGHLAPYCNGEEVELESGLPLGIAADLEYGETGLQLHHGDRLMLLSDGVVEARKADGELFGFERTRAISTQSAEQIAKAAEVFGQEDDITVLTVSFEPA